MLCAGSWNFLTIWLLSSRKFDPFPSFGANWAGVSGSAVSTLDLYCGLLARPFKPEFIVDEEGNQSQPDAEQLKARIQKGVAFGITELDHVFDHLVSNIRWTTWTAHWFSTFLRFLPLIAYRCISFICHKS
jgi:hypothetical protein